MKVLFIALNTFREAVRNQVLYSVLLFALLLIAVSSVFGSVSVGDQLKVMKDFALFSLSFFGAIVAIAAGVNLLNRELKQKTIYNILSKPVPRWKFILGKQIGLIAVTCVLVSMAGLTSFIFVGAFEGRIDPLLFQGLAMILLELIIVSSLTIFFSALVITTTLAGFFTIGTYLAGRSISYLNYFFAEGSNASMKALTNGLKVILPDLSVFNYSDQLVYGTPIAPEQLLFAAIYSISYSCILFLLAAGIFRYRELQ